MLCRLLACLALLAPAVLGQGLAYDEPFFPGSSHSEAVTSPEALLGFPLGERPATHAEIERCLQVWAAQSDRAELFVHGYTFEGRPLYHLVVSDPSNIARLDGIKRDLARLEDARLLPEAEADSLLARTPAVAWLGYSIHGDELSGADAGMLAAWHLASCTDEATEAMLRDTVVIIDPMMNPDGRERYLAQLREMRGALPTADDQSRLHGGRWPRGRTNHYLFDMNRDWVLGVNPETRARVRAAGAWHPVLFVDAHEMGAQDTYLFGPAREPINGNYPEGLRRWLDVFTADQSGAFDVRGWRYYTGEWADDWYPGYSNAWASFRGAVGILYEQAGVDWYGVRRPEGRVLTYRESVHHQLESTLANLETLRANREGVQRNWLETRRECVDPGGRFAGRTYAIVPGSNRSRVAAMLDALELQGFELFELTEAFSAPGSDRLGHEIEAVELEPGTILLPNLQPDAHLLAAMMEFDPRMKDEFLAKERTELIRKGETELYDITGWSLPMLFDVEAYELRTDLPEGSVRAFEGWAERDGGLAGRVGGLGAGAGQGWVIDGADDRTPAMAMDLLLAGVRVRLADEAFSWGGVEHARGSLVIAREDQPRDDDGWVEQLDRLCAARGLVATPIRTGLGAGVIADIGGEHFHLLETPRIAVLSESPVSVQEFGSVWYTLDERYGLPASYLPARSLAWADLRRYNILVAPSGSGEALARAGDDLRRWIESGGTLVAIGSAAFSLAGEDNLSAARPLDAVLDDLDEYEIAVLREWAAEAGAIEPGALWSHSAGAAPAVYPWDGIDMDRGDDDELERQDRWSRQFMPPGTILAARFDDEHWLSVGCDGYLPVLFQSYGVLMARDGVEAPFRYGLLEGDASREEASRVGWCTIPAGSGLRLRMCGLLWPEAAQRIANSAAVTRERLGRGQIIFFPEPPTFRASTWGATRVFLNAVVYGPGMGASAPIEP